MNISEDLKQKAIKLNLCQEWTNEWGNPDMDELVEMYLEGLDFCILNNYPDNNYIKQHFGEIAERHGVFTDKQAVDLLDPHIAVLNGACMGKIEVNDFNTSDIYVRHNSQVKITVKDFARVFIRVFDDAKVYVDNQSKSRVFVYRYGGTATFDGAVTVREESLDKLG